MEAKQVNIAVPLKLYSKIEDYVKEYGYRNTQDLFLDLVRQKVVFENLENHNLKEDFVDEMLSLNKKDFLGVEESETFHQELKKKSKL